MNANLLTLAQEAMGSDFSKLTAQFLGESHASTQSAVTALLPAVLGAVAQKGATPAGASGLLALLSGAKLDAISPGNVAGLFSGSGMNDILKAGTGNLVPALFGDKSASLVNALTTSSGIKSSSATNLLAMIVPIVLAILKKFVGDKGLNAGSLSTLLASQGPNLQNVLDNRITGALGFASPAAFLGGLGGQATDTARRVGAAVVGGAESVVGTAAAAAATTKSGFMRWLPWLIGLAVLWFLWSAFMGKPATNPAPPPGAIAPAVTPAPTSAALAPAMAGYPFKVYFDTGSAAIGPVSSATISAAADAARKDNAKVALTGYTDRTGDVAKNEELAKSRAVAVRDALKAAGVADVNMEMRPPIFVEVGAGGSDAEARRVDIGK